MKIYKLVIDVSCYKQECERKKIANIVYTLLRMFIDGEVVKAVEPNDVTVTEEFIYIEIKADYVGTYHVIEHYIKEFVHLMLFEKGYDLIVTLSPDRIEGEDTESYPYDTEQLCLIGEK